MKLRLKAKLTLSFLLASVVPLLVLFAVSVQLSSSALEEAANDRLLAIEKNKAQELNNWFERISSQIKSISGSSISYEAYSALNVSTYEFELDSMNWGKVDAELVDFYQTKFKPKFDEQNYKVWDEAKAYVAAMDKTTKYLQYQYIVKTEEELGQKLNVFDAGDKSSYTKEHKYYHAFYKSYLENFEFYDIYLVDNETGKIIYSVYKEVDFGTSLIDGPLKDASITKVFEQAKAAKQEDEVFVTDMLEYLPSYGSPAMFMSSPVFVGGENQATLIFQLPLSNIDMLLTGDNEWAEIGFGETGEIFLVGSDKRMRSVSRDFYETTDSFLGKFEGKFPEQVKYMMSKDTSVLSVTLDTVGVEKALAGDNSFQKYTNHMGRSVLGVGTVLDLGGVEWALVAEIGEEEALAQVNELIFRNFSLMGVSVFIVVLLSLFIARSIANPISKVSQSLKSLAEGHLKSDLEVSTKDEVGDMVNSLRDTLSKLQGIFKAENVDWSEVEKQKEQVDKALATANEEARKAGEALKHAKKAETEANEAKEEAETLGMQQLKNAKELQRKVDKILTVVDECRTGDLTRQIDVEGSDAIGKVGGGLKSFFGDLRARIEEISSSSELMGTASNGLMENSDNMSEISEKTVSLSQDVSSEASRVASSINEVNNSTGQLSHSFKEVASHTTQAAQLAHKAVDETSSAMTKIQDLEQRSQEIEEIIHVINSISRQTNLLALNATIEAARAGEAGKGFAVVANEVKELAGQTNDATNQIREQIERMQSGTSEVVEVIQNSSQIVTEINNVTAGIASTVEEQSSVTQEISNSMNLLNQSVQDIQTRMNDVLDLTTETNKGVDINKNASKEFKDLSTKLGQLVSHFKVDGSFHEDTEKAA